MGKPLYRQLEENIKNKIVSGEYRIGDTIMSEREMADKYQINRLTVRKAMEPLKKEGYLESIQGKGTIVIDVPNVSKNVKAGYGSSVSLSRNLSQSGYKSSRKVISLKKIKVSGKLRNYFNPDNDVYELTRLSYIDDIPYALQICYFPADKFESPERFDFENYSIYTYMDSQGNMPVYFQTNMCVSKITGKYLNVLDIDKDKLFFYCQYISFSENYDIVEYTEAYYLPEYTNFRYITSNRNLD